MNRLKTHSKKAFIGILGGLVVLIGLILIPYPGPGWLIVFGGLAILSTEFEFAERTLRYARGKYDAWVEWLKHQNVFIRILVLSFTGLVVLVTLWLVNALGIIVNLLNLPYPFTLLVSPFFR